LSTRDRPINVVASVSIRSINCVAHPNLLRRRVSTPTGSKSLPNSRISNHGA
jgi:hypothetical protein